MGHLIAAVEISYPIPFFLSPLHLYSAIDRKIAPRYKPRRYLLLLCYSAQLAFRANIAAPRHQPSANIKSVPIIAQPPAFYPPGWQWCSRY